VICGFPNESVEDFEETMALVAKYKFPVLHISQFYPRHGTPAARMERVNTKEVKRRSKQLTGLFESYTTRDNKVGRVMRVLCTEVARDKKHLVGHNKSYDQVLLPMRPELRGKAFDVRITEV
jgi:threonylcarbamoyladenosine tRNA methylthiotransferase CDKAL1